MQMKTLLPILCLCALLCGCTDKNYDINEIDDDQITIGNDESQFEVPLATITIPMSSLQNNTSDIQSIFDEVDTWLPTDLPNNAESVNIARMATDETYVDSIFDALLDEMLEPDSPKMDAVVALIWERTEYKDRIAAILPDGGNLVTPELFETAFKLVLSTENPVRGALEDAVHDLAKLFLSTIRIDPVSYELQDLGVPDGVKTMLLDNLDSVETPNPINYVELYGEVLSEFPISFSIEPTFRGTGVTIDPFEIEPNVASPIPPATFYREGVETLFNNFAFDVAFEPQNYYPGGTFDEEQSVVVRVRLRKHGGLTL